MHCGNYSIDIRRQKSAISWDRCLSWRQSTSTVSNHRRQNLHKSTKKQAPGLTRYSSVRVSAVVNAVTLRLPTDGTESANAVNSWKWVANRQNPRTTVAACLQHQDTSTWSIQWISNYWPGLADLNQCDLNALIFCQKNEWFKSCLFLCSSVYIMT